MAAIFGFNVLRFFENVSMKCFAIGFDTVSDSSAYV